MPSQRSASATISSLSHGTVLKYSRPLLLHNRNHNNKYVPSPQSRALQQDQSQSHLTGRSTPSLEIKRRPHLAPVNIPRTAQLVNPGYETAALYFPPTQLNYSHSQQLSEKDSLRQQSSRTNTYEYTGNATSKQDTPSTLNKWSPLSEENPSYSKFTLGLSASIFPSFLFPQQVTHPKSPLNYDTVNSPSFSLGSSSPKSPPHYHAENASPSSYSGSSATSCSEEDPSFSSTVHYHVDSANIFGDVDSPTLPTPPATIKKKERKLTRRPPQHWETQQFDHPFSPMERRDELRESFRTVRAYEKYQNDSSASIPRRFRPESGYLGQSPQKANTFSSKPKSSSRPNKSVDTALSIPSSPRIDSSIPKLPPSTPASPYAQRELIKTDDARGTSVAAQKGTSSGKENPWWYDTFKSSTEFREAPSFAKEQSVTGIPKPRPPKLPASTNEDISAPSAPYKRVCARKSQPWWYASFKLSTEFKEPPKYAKVQTLTGGEFQHFINTEGMAAVMFHDGTKDAQEALKVWDKEALKVPAMFIYETSDSQPVVRNPFVGSHHSFTGGRQRP